MAEIKQVLTDEQISSMNPYQGSGSPAGNWRRGFVGERLIAMKGSTAEKCYKQGQAARKAFDSAVLAASERAASAGVEQEPDGYQLRVSPFSGEWSNWFGCSKDEYDQVISTGRDSWSRLAEARPVYAHPTTNKAAQPLPDVAAEREEE